MASTDTTRLADKMEETYSTINSAMAIAWSNYCEARAHGACRTANLWHEAYKELCRRAAIDRTIDPAWQQAQREERSLHEAEMAREAEEQEHG